MALELWTLHASRQCPHRAVRRQSGVGISFMTSFYIHTLRSGRRLARGSQKALTLESGPALQPAPAGAVGPLKKQPRQQNSAFSPPAPLPLGRGHLFGWAHHPGVRKKRSPGLIFSHPSEVEEQLELRAGSAPNLPGTCLINERRV